MIGIKTVSQLNAPYPVTFPNGNTGMDNITTALHLVKLAGVAINHEGFISSDELMKALSEQLDLIERFLMAGASWARDADAYLTDAGYIQAGVAP